MPAQYNSSLIVDVTLNVVRTDSQNQVIIDLVDQAGRIYANEFSSGKFSFDYGNHTPFGTANIANETRRYASSCNGTTATYYQDGISQTTTTDLDRFIAVPTSIRLGSLSSGASPLYGHIKNLRIFDKALSAVEVSLA